MRGGKFRSQIIVVEENDDVACKTKAKKQKKPPVPQSLRPLPGQRQCDTAINRDRGGPNRHGNEDSDDSGSDVDMDLFMATALSRGCSDSESSDDDVDGCTLTRAAGLGTMPISEAQKTKVVRVPNVFTEDDIAALLSFHKEWKLAFGMDAKKHGAAVTNWRILVHDDGKCSCSVQLFLARCAQ